MRKNPTEPAIGIIQFIDIHPVHRAAELTTRIGVEADRGQGYGTEAVALALDFARRDLNLNRVWLRVYATNKPAMRIYQKTGFVEEGVMRKAAWINGAWVDQIVMACVAG